MVNAVFCEHENSLNYFLLTQELVENYGAPVALYIDRHAVFKHTPGSGLAGAPTQFSRAMDELGIRMIFALSPQAKGRVERTAETFQDRLVTELRLAGAATIAEADGVLQGFLPRFNTRFAVPPPMPEAAYRPLALDVCLDRIPASSTAGRSPGQHREVPVAYPAVAARAGTSQLCWRCGEVLEGLDGNLSLQHQGRIIPSQRGRRPIRYSCEPATDHIRPLPAAVPVLTIRPGLGRRPSPNSAHTVPKEPLMTRLPTAGAKPARRHSPRKPTFLQKARWQAIQKAKRRGMSIRGIARELGYPPGHGEGIPGR